MSIFAAGTWAAIGSVASAGAGIYSSVAAANAAKKAGQSAQRDLGGEIATITGQLPTVSAAGLANQQQYAGQYNSLGNTNLSQGLLGTRTFDAAAAFAAKPENEQASIRAEAAATGRTPEQWLTDHTMEQGAAGNQAAQADFSRFGGYAGGLTSTLGELQRTQDQANAASSTYQRSSNLADMQALGPAAANLQRSLNPELYGNFNALDASARAAGSPGVAGNAFLASAQQGSTGAPLAFDAFSPTSVANTVSDPGAASAIEQALQKQALDELALGDQLSADEARQVRVQSRAAADARGRGFSNAALADEVLNTANARRTRLDSRRGFASSANQLFRSGQAADRSYGLARDSFRAGIDQFNSGLGLSAAQLNSGNRLNAAQFNAGRTDADRAALAQAAAFEQGVSGDAFSRQLAATSARGQFAFNPASVLGQVDNRLNSTTTLGMGQQQFQGAPDYLNQLLGYGQDVNSNNSNARAAAGINSANAYSSLGGGLLSAAGSLGSAYFGSKTS